MDDEAVSHYCCHLLCGGWGITAAGAKGCVHPPSPYDCSSQVVAKDDDERVVGVVDDLTGWQWLEGYIPNSVAYSS